MTTGVHKKGSSHEKTRKSSTGIKVGSGKNGWRPNSNGSPLHSTQVLMVLVGVITWCITYLANTLPDAPLVELAQSYTKSGDERLIKIKISNLSRTIKISDLKLGLSSREKGRGKYSNHSLFAIAPAAEGDDSRSYTQTNDETVMFVIGGIHPGQQFVLLATYTGIDLPEVRLVSASQPVYLLNSGLVTKLVKWIVPALLILAAVVIFYFIYSMVFPSISSTNHRK